MAFVDEPFDPAGIIDPIIHIGEFGAGLGGVLYARRGGFGLRGAKLSRQSEGNYPN